jgi:hypothetical protein
LRELLDLTGHRNVEQRLYRERTGLYDDLITNIAVSKSLVVCVEASIFPQGWEIWISPGKGTYRELKVNLQKLEIPFEEYEEDGGVSHRDSYKHKYNESLDGISSLLQELIDEIATGQKQRKIAR